MNTAEGKIVLAELPRGFVGGARLWSTGGYADLLFEVHGENGVVHTGFRLTSVRALRFRQETHCTSWHIEGAYGQLVEVRPSEWITELAERLVENARSPSEWDMHHYLIYIPDEGGAFEVAAESWRVLPERGGLLPTHWTGGE